MSELPGASARLPATPITAQDINGGPDPERRVPFVITAPGVYTLVEDVDWVAHDADARAITIASDERHPRPVRQDAAADRPSGARRRPRTRARGLAGARSSPGTWACSPRGGSRLVIEERQRARDPGVGIAARACSQLDLLDLSVRRCGGDGVLDTGLPVPQRRDLRDGRPGRGRRRRLRRRDPDDQLRVLGEHEPGSISS